MYSCQFILSIYFFIFASANEKKFFPNTKYIISCMSHFPEICKKRNHSKKAPTGQRGRMSWAPLWLYAAKKSRRGGCSPAAIYLESGWAVAGLIGVRQVAADVLLHREHVDCYVELGRAFEVREVGPIVVRKDQVPHAVPPY